MRILHTSDWHLGRTLGDQSLLADQSLVADRLVEVVRSEGIELVAIAGDIFDRSLPPVDAITLWWDTVRRIRSTGAVVAAISGNHDSADRLGSTDGITDLAGVYIRGGYHRAGSVTEVALHSGPLALVTTPFLDPLTAPHEMCRRLCGLDPAASTDGADGAHRPHGDRAPESAPRVIRRPSHEAVLADSLQRARAALPTGMASLVLSHAFVTGAAPTDSERELAVGDAAMVSASVYEGFDYVALGHLHRPQSVAGTSHIRYSGSPLPFSFSETAAKQMVLVELDQRGFVGAEGIDVGVGRGVKLVRGSLDELISSGGHDDHWVRAELTDAERPLDPARRLRDVFPHLVEVSWVGGVADAGGGVTASDVRASGPHELAASFWLEATGEPAPSDVVDVLATVLGPGGASHEDAA